MVGSISNPYDKIATVTDLGSKSTAEYRIAIRVIFAPIPSIGELASSPR